MIYDSLCIFLLSSSRAALPFFSSLPLRGHGGVRGEHSLGEQDTELAMQMGKDHGKVSQSDTAQDCPCFWTHHSKFTRVRPGIGRRGVWLQVVESGLEGKEAQLLCPAHETLHEFTQPEVLATVVHKQTPPGTDVTELRGVLFALVQECIPNVRELGGGHN